MKMLFKNQVESLTTMSKPITQPYPRQNHPKVLRPAPVPLTTTEKLGAAVSISNMATI